jgi:CheY-specific phosphatase CheX
LGWVGSERLLVVLERPETGSGRLANPCLVEGQEMEVAHLDPAVVVPLAIEFRKLTVKERI